MFLLCQYQTISSEVQVSGYLHAYCTCKFIACAILMLDCNERDNRLYGRLFSIYFFNEHNAECTVILSLVRCKVHMCSHQNRTEPWSVWKRTEFGIFERTKSRPFDPHQSSFGCSHQPEPKESSGIVQ